MTQNIKEISMKTITATFKTRLAAEDTLAQLEAAGVDENQIGIVITDETRGTTFGIKEGNKSEEGLAAGATLGGLAGAILAGIAGAGVIAIPGLNLVVAGTIVSALAGLGAGAATGGLVGALIGAGIPEHEAKLYEKELKEGNILMAVRPKGKEQTDIVRDILSRADAYHVAA